MVELQFSLLSNHISGFNYYSRSVCSFMLSFCLKKNKQFRFTVTKVNMLEEFFHLYLTHSSKTTLKVLNGFTSDSLSDSDSVEVKVVYGVEGNSTFLECVSQSPQAELRWTVQPTETQEQTVGQNREGGREVSHVFRPL